MKPLVTLVAGGERIAIGDGEEPTTVPAETVVIDIAQLGSSAIHLDGRPCSVSRDSIEERATFAVDLTRDTGFHELRVGREAFVFATEDAKLKLEGIQELLDYLRANSLRWSGAMFFSGTDDVLRDPKLDAAWLDLHGSEVLQNLEDIAADPWSRAIRVPRRGTHGVPHVAATMSLLRRRRDLLEPFDDGPITVELGTGSQSYVPRQVMVRNQSRSFDVAGNRRATALGDGVAALARVLATKAPTRTRASFTKLASDLEAGLQRRPFRDLRRRKAHLRVPQRWGVEEREDSRYVRAQELYASLYEDRHWDPRREVLPERAYVGHADGIYQRFVGQLLADHYGMNSTSVVPGTEPGPHFANDRFDLYLDVSPPAPLVDWRDKSERPTRRRPDIVLHERASGRTALLDAKYRAAGARASESSLSEVQLYLQAYSRRRIGVVYPPVASSVGDPWSVHAVTDGSHAIYEIPMSGASHVAGFLPEIESCIEKLLDA